MTELVRYDAACRAVAECKTVDEAKDIRDKAVALKAYARQAKNPQLEADAWEIRKRAEDRLGELSAALDREKPGRGHKGERVTFANGGKSKAEALTDAGISQSAAHRYEKFHELPPGEKEARIARGRAYIEAGKSIADSVIRGDDKAERRAEREQALGAKQHALPEKRYGVIVADPEWRFEPWSRKTGMDRAADNHYPTSVIQAISAREVPSIAAEDCALFLWATVPMLPHALLVMAAWDFDYSSHLIWLKDRIGTGYWSRNKHELLLIGTRGKIPAPAMGTQPDSVIAGIVGEHSQKPEIFLDLIEGFYPSLPKIELNRRGPARPGWDAWGNETSGAAA